MGDLLDVSEVTAVTNKTAKKSRSTDIFGQRKSMAELEEMVKEMTASHEEELIALQNALKRHQADLQRKLNEKERECDEMKGRLEESRTARECTLQEFNALSDKHDDMQKYFKQQLAEITKERDALKESLENAQAAEDEVTAAEAEEAEKLKTEITRLRADKAKLLLDIEQKDRDARYRERILSSKTAKLTDTQKEFEKAKEDMSQMQSELMSLREFRASCNENQQAETDKSKRIEDLEKKVASLNSGKEKLKETLIVLDEQLKEFEMTVVEKNDEIDLLQDEKKLLESENASLKKVMETLKVEMKSFESVKSSLEQKLMKVESSLEKIEGEHDYRVTQLQEQLAKVLMSNQEMEEQCEEVVSRSQSLEARNEHLQKCVEALRIECSDHRDENAVVVNQYVREKNALTECQTELQELKATNESLRAKIDSMQEELALLEFEKNEIDVKMKTMLKQQIKLIEYLQSENEILTSKKKKTFVGRILGRDKDKEPFVPPTPKVATLPAKLTKETPSCVLKEQNIVRYLEAEANKLRLQLSCCKAHESDKENCKDRDAAIQTSKALELCGSKSTETQTSGSVSAQPRSDDTSDLEHELAALAAMDNAVGEDESLEADSDLSGYERDLYFAERARRGRLGQCGGTTETDTDDGS